MINRAQTIKSALQLFVLEQSIETNGKPDMAEQESPVVAVKFIGDVYDDLPLEPPEGMVFELTRKNGEKEEMFVPDINGESRYNAGAPIKPGRTSLIHSEFRHLIGLSPFGVPSKDVIEKMKAAEDEHRTKERKHLLKTFDFTKLNFG